MTIIIHDHVIITSIKTMELLNKSSNEVGMV